MSFASDTKNEICRTPEDKLCCKKAECYGLVIFTRLFSLHPGAFNTENHGVTRRLSEDAAACAGVIVQTKSAMHRNTASYAVTFPEESSPQALLSYFGHTGLETNLRINRGNLENDCCTAAFLRGAFLSCGSVSDPYKEYHLEFVSPFLKLTHDLTALISELGFEPAVANRKGSYVVYIKESEAIADLLTMIGAPQASMNLMQAKMLKEVRNYVNRKTNFETANIDKTVSASSRQCDAIRRLVGNSGTEALPEDLREIASLRLENPEMSLSELGKLLGLSRSGVNHRLMRLVALAEKE